MSETINQRLARILAAILVTVIAAALMSGCGHDDVPKTGDRTKYGRNSMTRKDLLTGVDAVLDNMAEMMGALREDITVSLAQKRIDDETAEYVCAELDNLLAELHTAIQERDQYLAERR